jgi:arylsulfatase A-like enzyme
MIKRYYWWIFVLLLFCVSAPRVRWYFRSWSRPSVLILTLDAFRFKLLMQHSRFSTSARHPLFLPSLCSSSLYFSQVISPTPQSLPVHASLFTGVYPRSHRVQYEAGFCVTPRFVTLAEALQNEGYETSAFVSSWFLRKETGLSQGFSFYDDDFETPPRSILDPFQPHQRRAGEVVNRFQQWIQQKKNNSPFLSWLHFSDATAPYSAPASSQKLGTPYFSELFYIDSQIQRLFKILEEEGVASQTLVLLCTTFGESLQEHQETQHGTFLYDSTVCGDVLWHYPGSYYPQEYREAISLLDLYPTLLDFLKIKDPSFPSPLSFQGESLLSFFDAGTSSASKGREFFLETQFPLYQHGWHPLEGIRSEEWKYLWRGEDQGQRREELYHLKKDPQEENNLVLDPLFQESLQYWRQRRLIWREKLCPFPFKALKESRWMGESQHLQGRQIASEYETPWTLNHESILKTFDLFLNREQKTSPLLDPLLPGRVYTSVLLAQKKIEAKEWESAEKEIQEMLRVDPHHLQSLLFLAQIYRKTQRYSQSLTLLESPRLRDDLEAGLEIAECFQCLQEWQKAEEFLQKLVQRYPDSPLLYRKLGTLYEENGLTQRSIASFQKYLEQIPKGDPREKILIRSKIRKLSEGL